MSRRYRSPERGRRKGGEQKDDSLSLFRSHDNFLVPVDPTKCTFCREEKCERLPVRFFFPGTNSRGERNYYEHRQNEAIMPVCRGFITLLENAEFSSLSSETSEGRVRPYCMLAFAGNVFQKYYLGSSTSIEYFRHLRRTRLTSRNS